MKADELAAKQFTQQIMSMNRKDRRKWAKDNLATQKIYGINKPYVNSERKETC